MLRDLDSLLHEVRDERTRPLVSEAVKAYGAGAMRAATVSLWIAVVADLIFKIRFLAESDDGEASKAIKELDRAIEKKEVRKVQEFERGLLRLAGEQLELLSDREVTEMERLNEDRNLCAHPGFLASEELFAPDAETVRAHLASAVRGVFSQPPLSGKRLLATLDGEISGDGWPDRTRGGLREYLLRRYFHAARGVVQRNLLKVLVKGSIGAEAERAGYAERCADAVHAVADDLPLECAGVLAAVLKSREDAGALGDAELLRAVGAFGGRSDFWEALPRTAADRLEGLLERCEPQLLVDTGFFRSGEVTDERFSDAFAAAVSRLDPVQLAGVLQTARRRSAFVPQILEFVGDSRTFRHAEAHLRLLEAVSAELSVDDVRALTDAVQRNGEVSPAGINQIRWAAGTQAILLSVFEGCPESTEHAEEWRKLAAWLREQWNEGDDESYRYDELCARVGLDGGA